MSKKLFVMTLVTTSAVVLGFVWLNNRKEQRYCLRLPSSVAAEQALQDHQSTVQELEALKPGHINVFVNPERCEGKGEIVITFPGRGWEDDIQEVLGPTFHGVPYTLANV